MRARIQTAALAIAMVSAAALALAQDEAARRGDATKALTQALAALDQRRYSDAISAAREATEADPMLAEAWDALGRAHAGRASATQYDQERAIDAYARHYILTQSKETQGELSRLFFEGDPPRWLTRDTLVVLPGRLREETVAHHTAGTEPEGEPTAIAVTTGLVYPPEVPTRHPHYGTPFSRVSYGYITDRTDPEQRLFLQARLYYPSPAQSKTGADYRRTAADALSLILRLVCYRAEYWGEPTTLETEEPLNVWLTEGAETGAESLRRDITIFGVDQPREPIAWVRQICHEFGHLAFQPVGMFRQPEPWANGLIGEYVLCLWLWQGEPDGQVRWGDQTVDLERFLNRSAGTMVQGFLAGVPDGKLIYDEGMAGVNHAVGATLYASLLLGPRALAAPHGASAASIRLPEYMDELARAFEFHEGGLRIPGRLFSQPESRLDEGVDLSDYGRGPVAIPVARGAVYWIYLARGQWTMALSVQPMPEEAGPTVIRIDVEGRSPVTVTAALETGAALASADLGPKAPGWYRVTIRHDNRQAPLALNDLVFAHQEQGEE